MRANERGIDGIELPIKQVVHFYFMPTFMVFLSLFSGVSLRENLKQCVCCSDWTPWSHSQW
jgi:hypothetical protein